MIEIGLTQALAIYTGLLGLVIGAIWIYTELSVRRPQRRLGHQFLWRCTFCRCTYLDESAQRISQCPRCENLNVAEEAASWDRVAEPEPAAPRTESGRNTSRRRRHHQRRRGPRRRR